MLVWSGTSARDLVFGWSGWRSLKRDQIDLILEKMTFRQDGFLHSWLKAFCAKNAVTKSKHNSFFLGVLSGGFTMLATGVWKMLADLRYGKC